MTQKEILALLVKVYGRKTTPQKAAKKLKQSSFEDLGFAMVDHHREKRKGAPEIIYCQGKTPEQVKRIARAIIDNGSVLLGTRLSPENYAKIRHDLPEAEYHPVCRAVTHIPTWKRKPGTGNIVVACAGTSDIPVAEEAAVTAEVLGNRVVRIFDAGVAGLHRLLAHHDKISRAKVIVAVAGMEGALPSVVSGLVRAPVIAVPTSVGYGASFGGIAALLAMLNSCASGVTVVNIDNGFGAGYAASQINKMASGK
jgi:hypothetical protein